MSGYRAARTTGTFDGWSNERLATEVQKLSSGQLAHKFADASDGAARPGEQPERRRRGAADQLKALGIDWRGAAGEKGQEKTKVSAEGLNDARRVDRAELGRDSASRARAPALPATARLSRKTLRGDTEQNFKDKVGGFFGVETDHAAEVEATNAARQQAIDSLNGYISNSQSSLDGFRAPSRRRTSSSASAAVVHARSALLSARRAAWPSRHSPAAQASPAAR